MDIYDGGGVMLSFIVLPMHLSSPISAPDERLSTATGVAITAVVCLLVAFIAGTVCGALITLCIIRWNKKGRSSKPAPNTQEHQQTVAVYEEVDTLQSRNIELRNNVAYEPANLT